VDYSAVDAGPEDIILTPAACGICATDIKQVQKGAKDTRFALGHELAGTIKKPSASQAWKQGQRVAVAPYLPCGQCYYCMHGQQALCTHLYDICIQPGGLVEEVLVPAELCRRGMFTLPDELSFEAASLAEPLGCVVKGLEDAHFQPGGSFLVIGDGPMGQLAAAAARSLDARLVLVAGATEHRLQFAKTNFADVVINVTEANLRDEVNKQTDARGADCVLVTVSRGETLSDGIACVRPGGTVNAFAGVPEGTVINLDVRKIHYQQYYLTGSSGVTPAHMQKALELLQARKADFAKVITASFPFARAAEAVAYAANLTGLKAVVTF
jgi:L-iditol 2-dehydrogenase